MKVENIERAIALVDPLGLIHMGAPFDEYESEARNIYEIVGESFSDDKFLHSYLEVIRASFGPTAFTRFQVGEREQLLAALHDEVDPTTSFVAGQNYRVAPHSLRGAIEIKQQPLVSGEIITCVSRQCAASSNGRDVFLMIRGTVYCQTADDHIDEARTRWYFEEVA